MNEPPELAFEGGRIRAAIDLRAYRLLAVKKAAYRLADRCTAILGSPSGDTLPLVLEFKSTTEEAAARAIARHFFQELLDQELREEIAEKTEPLRALILAHAFSKTDLIRRE